MSFRQMITIDAALLEATQHSDELRRLDLSNLQATATVVPTRPLLTTPLSRPQRATLPEAAQLARWK